MTMDEHKRQEYLHHMGIQSYFPRYLLPAARASELCTWTEAPELSVESGEHSSSAIRISPVAELKTSLFEPSPPPNRESRAKAVEQQPAAAEPAIITDIPDNAITGEVDAASGEIRFQLAFIQLNDSMLALILLPHARSANQLSQSQKLLLRNICIAMGQDPGTLNVGIKPFSWPFVEAAHMDKSVAAAKIALGAYMDQLRDIYSYRQILLMGEKIAGLMPTYPDCDVTVCRSLDELLHMPRLKRELWQQIKQARLIGKV